MAAPMRAVSCSVVIRAAGGVAAARITTEASGAAQLRAGRNEAKNATISERNNRKKAAITGAQPGGAILIEAGVREARGDGMENKPLIYFHAMQILVERKLLDHGAHGRFIVAADGVN